MYCAYVQNVHAFDVLGDGLVENHHGEPHHLILQELHEIVCKLFVQLLVNVLVLFTPLRSDVLIEHGGFLEVVLFEPEHFLAVVAYYW